MNKKSIQKSLVLLASISVFFGAAHLTQRINSASLTSVSVTLANSRLSFRGALTSGNTALSSQVIINTTPGAYPSTSSAQLVQGDVVSIGEAGSLGSYTVATSSSNSTLSVSPVLASGDADSGDDVISTQSGSLTVRFTTASAINGGSFRVLVPALTDNTSAADGLPDAGYFDYSTSTPTVTCPADISGYDFGTGAAAASAVTLGGIDYHSFTCAYVGTGAIGTVFDGTTNGTITISSLINPAPKSNHTTGTADTYNVIVQHLDGSSGVVDQTTTQVGAIEAVKVTASVPAQITFRILGVASGTSACGQTTGVTTSAAAVPFGELSISAFSDAAQSLSVSTNAANGFVVTAKENDQLGRNGGACAGDPYNPTANTDCIRDASGNGDNMTHTAAARWDSTTYKGFGYSLHDVNTSTTVPFSYSTTSGNCSGGTWCAKQFADAENSEVAQTIFSATAPADNDNIYVCYRVIPDVTTAAGNYENYITYTATATF